MNYTHFSNLITEAKIPEKGIHSRALHQDDQTKVVLFAFAEGEELSEHTASMPAILHVLQGDCHLTLGTEAHDASDGFWTYMQPKLPHSLKAKTPVIMLLILLKSGKI